MPKVTKKSNAWDVKALPWKGPATYVKYDDREVKSKKGSKDLNLYDLYFEVDDVDGNEAFEGLEIKKGIWYDKDDDGGIQMSAPNFQILEALEGLDKNDAKDDGEQSDVGDLIGNRVLLTVNESTKNPGFPEITRVDPYDDDDDEDDEVAKKAAKKAKKKAKKKAAEKAAKKAATSDDDDDDGDDEEESASEKKARLKAEKKAAKAEKEKAAKKAAKKAKEKAAAKDDDDDDDDDDEEPWDEDDDDDDDDD